MQQEIITMREEAIAARIQNSNLIALRRKDIQKQGVRVFAQDRIGVAGSIGVAKTSDLVAKARENLSAAISYPYPVSANRNDHRDQSKMSLDDVWLEQTTQGILTFLREEQPDLAFSESIVASRQTQQMENSARLNLSYTDTLFSLELILKEKASAHLFDGFALYHGRHFDLNRFIEFNQNYLAAYHRKVALPQGDKLAVFMLNPPEIQNFLSRALNGENFATGSSYFSRKMNQTLFSEKVQIELCRDGREVYAPFFDKEGVTFPDDRMALIENGRLVRVYTDKRSADRYDLPHVGAATGDFDDVPSLGRAPLHFAIDSDNLAADLQGRPAILVLVSSGGDFTPDGHFAAPVQVSFLFDGEKIIGKLPEFGLRSHLDAMLGRDYLGTYAADMFYFGENIQLQGYEMSINR